MWSLVGKDESRGPQGSEASPGFEGLSILASWMARTAYTNSTSPFLVLFSSFIWVGWGARGSSRVSFGARLSLPRPVRGCHLPLLFPFLHSVCTLELQGGWVGEEQPFFFLSLRLSTEKQTFPWGWGKQQWLTSCHPRGSRNRKSLKEQDRIGGRISQGGVNLTLCGVKVPRGTRHLFLLDISAGGMALIPCLVLEDQEEFFRGYLGVC